MCYYGNQIVADLYMHAGLILHKNRENSLPRLYAPGIRTYARPVNNHKPYRTIASLLIAAPSHRFGDVISVSDGLNYTDSIII